MVAKSVQKYLRIGTGLIALFLPAIFLLKGIYGSFIFSFTIPLLWQISFLGKSLGTLGLRRKLLEPSLITGIISGTLFALLGIGLLNYLGIKGHAIVSIQGLEYPFHFLGVEFSLQQELGYRLLSRSDTLSGLFLYLLFCIFLVGLGEEIFWRGFIQQKISTHLSKNKSVWLTATLFSLVHFYIFLILPIYEAMSFLVCIAIAGALWGYLFEQYKNIWAPAVYHGIVAFVVWKYFSFSFLF